MRGLSPLRLERLQAGITATEVAQCYQRAVDSKPCTVQFICDVESQPSPAPDVEQRYREALAAAIQAREAQ